MNYKEILKGIINIINTTEKSNIGFANICSYIGENCPELKETEDEKIRKDIMILVNDWWDRVNKNNISTKEQMLAWLEKQAKQKPVVIDFKAKNWYVSKVDGKIHDMTYNPIDKVEPKFHKGEWVVDNECGKVNQITSVRNQGYDFANGDYMSYKSAHKELRLWDISDAKDGDVLVDVYGNIGIFQKKDDFDWESYCSLGFHGGSQIFHVPHENYKTHPATKEERDLLFQRMKDAGYQWDADKKELKMIK